MAQKNINEGKGKEALYQVWKWCGLHCLAASTSAYFMHILITVLSSELVREITVYACMGFFSVGSEVLHWLMI